MDKTTDKLFGDLIPLSKWNEHYRYPSVGALRQYMFHAKKNGFDKVIRRIGKRIYISTSDFNKWIESINAGEDCQ